jgi:hypothetical protein
MLLQVFLVLNILSLVEAALVETVLCLSLDITQVVVAAVLVE